LILEENRLNQMLQDLS
jgi:hypothetical protein